LVLINESQEPTMATKTVGGASAPKELANQAYTVLEPILHNGKKYLPGQPVELTDEQAKSMQARRLVGDLVIEEGAE
jgi:hypothetical protein